MGNGGGGVQGAEGGVEEFLKVQDVQDFLQT